MKPPRNSTKAFERSRLAEEEAAKAPRPLELRLYVAGTSFRSTRAIQNAKEICEAHFEGRYQLEVIDIFQQPALAKDDHVLAVPTLIRRYPAPQRRFIGDLSNRDVVVDGLDATPK